MKAALVSTFCLESTMPLSRYLVEESVDVHLFAILPKKNQNLFVVDFSKDKQPLGFVNQRKANTILGDRLCKYLEKVNTYFFVLHANGRKNLFSDIFYCWKLSKHISNQHYDVVHLIHTYGRISFFLLYFLRKQNLIQTLHEVTAHDGVTSDIDTKIFKRLVRKNIPIIFHSDVAKNRFLSHRKELNYSVSLENNLYTVIRFGLFETYKCFDLENQFIEKSRMTDSNIPIILHFGRIVPYKGIDVLIDAVKLVQKQKPVHLIIAGNGTPYFSFEGIDSYEFINRTITNEEIVELIKKSEMVVCPYKSASQSGIPSTVFLYNKPIIASNVGAFKEVIETNVNGILIDTISDFEFSEAILKLINNPDLSKNMSENIFKKFNVDQDYAWSQIAKNTLEFYRNIMN
jgi:glycosyltransferase involved in cell wall biosynthesis